MSRNNKTLLILTIFASVVLLIIPFILPTHYKEKLNIGFGFIAGLTSLLTLLIAVQLYDRFDSEKNLHQKRSGEVFKLIGLINQNFIIISLKNKDHHISLNPFSYDTQKIEVYYDKQIRISTNYLDVIRPILTLGAQIYLPSSIAEKVKKLDVFGLTDLSEYIKDDEVVVGAYPSNFPKDTIGKPIGREMSLMEFIGLWNDLGNEVKNWIKSNYDSYDQLNIN